MPGVDVDAIDVAPDHLMALRVEVDAKVGDPLEDAEHAVEVQVEPLEELLGEAVDVA